MATEEAADSAPVRLLAPAKLTLSLRITGTRPDGYHLIDAEMVTLDLCDEIIVHPSSEPSVEIVPAPVAHDRAGAAPDWDIPTDGSNLVIRALELAGRTAHVEIRKRIPPGAGLGGGSADAAAVLRWSNQMTALEGIASEQRITSQQAATLGADVAFCLVGGRAHVTGIGEIVEPLAFREQSFVLWTPPIGVDTAAVYRTWDALGGPAGEQSNDLEPAAVALVPELAAWRDELAQASRRTPQLAGSGGTWFVRAPYPVPTDVVQRRGVSATMARTIGRL